MAHLVLRLAERYPPLVLCLDDLHWADETTRAWVGYLGRRLREAPLLIIGGYRREERKLLEALRGSLARLNVLKEVRLEGLTKNEVGDLIQRLSGMMSGTERFSRGLHRLTGGNPFYLLETLRALFEAGKLEGTDSGWRGDLEELSRSLVGLEWIEGLTETVLRRVGRLRPASAQVLEAGTVIGEHFDLELVQATSGRTEGEVVEALDELAARQLIKISEGRYHFRDDLIRAVVGDSLSYGRKRLLHRRAGEALGERAPDNPAVLARHFFEAGKRG